MSAARLATIINENPDATLYDGGDGDWELIAADQPGIVKPAVTLARSGVDDVQPGDLLQALCMLAGINYRA